ncbi:hypothetical protein GCM10028807_49880 [Spirosoma daeguense]
MDYFKKLEEQLTNLVAQIRDDFKTVNRRIDELLTGLTGVKTDLAAVNKKMAEQQHVKYMVITIPDGANFDDYLTPLVEESEEKNDCRIVRFLFESDNLSNYWLIRGYDASMIAQFL